MRTGLLKLSVEAKGIMGVCGCVTKSSIPCARPGIEGGPCWQHKRSWVETTYERAPVLPGKPPIDPSHQVAQKREPVAPRPPPLLRTASEETKKAILELVGETTAQPDKPFLSKYER